MSQDSPARRKSVAKFRKTLASAERDAAACNLYYAQKKTYSQIAEILGYADESGAKKAADRGCGQSRPGGTRT
jgi:hypothetical protein